MQYWHWHNIFNQPVEALKHKDTLVQSFQRYTIFPFLFMCFSLWISLAVDTLLLQSSLFISDVSSETSPCIEWLLNMHVLCYRGNDLSFHGFLLSKCDCSSDIGHLPNDCKSLAINCADIWFSRETWGLECTLCGL